MQTTTHFKVSEINALQQQLVQALDSGESVDQFRQRARTVIVQVGGTVAVTSLNSAENTVLGLRPLGDSSIDQLAEQLHGLPDGLGLLLVRGAKYPRVFDLLNHPCPQCGKLCGAESGAAALVAQDSSGEVDQTRGGSTPSDDLDIERTG